MMAAPSLVAEPILSPSGVQIEITQTGTGPLPTDGQVVLVHYTGRLTDGTVFDTSRDGDRPFAFTLGKRQVIRGWDEAFRQLPEGSIATLTIPPDLAYGDRASDTIPANSTLIFDVQFVALKSESLADLLKTKIDADGLAAGQTYFAQLASEGFGDAYVSEGQLNSLGYRYLLKDQGAEALAIFQWNVAQFPDSANVYDSQGEAYVKVGDREAALASYRKSLEIDPSNANAEKFIRALESAGDGPSALASMQAKMVLDSDLNRLFEQQDAGEAIDLAAFRTKLDAYLADGADEDSGYSLVRNYLYLTETVDLPTALAAWRSFADHANPQVAALAAKKLRFAEELNAPLELKFTAIDGREVDLAQLRGKVVLVDFWATWCGPCIEELPNVKRVFSEYHSQGFEIVGISLDRVGDRAKLEQFVAREEMTWPQYYEGKKHNEGGNTVATRFAVTGIPAMLLIDRHGMIVSTNARGPKLESEVKRLLGL